MDTLDESTFQSTEFNLIYINTNAAAKEAFVPCFLFLVPPHTQVKDF